MANLNYGGYFDKLPDHMQEGVRGYIEKGIPTGTFLKLIIQNDYAHAAEAADHINLNALLDYIKFFLYAAPRACWGSEERYLEWLEKRGASNDGS